jgi:pimeloyl-ACP methyl ester carboxylesterase
LLPSSIESLTIAGYPALVTAESKGSRPDIVLIHGAFSHGEHFRSWVEYLGERGYAVVAPTLRRRDTLYALVLHKVAEVDRRALTRSFVTESRLVYREMILGRIRVAAGGRNCPVLCIAGTDDRIVSLGLARATAQRWRAPLRE